MSKRIEAPNMDSRIKIIRRGKSTGIETFENGRTIINLDPVIFPKPVSIDNVRTWPKRHREYFSSRTKPKN